MSYLDKFYKKIGAKTDFQKIVAANKFIAITVCEVVFNDLALEDVLDDTDIDINADKVCNYILADDALYNEIVFLSNAFGDYDNVTTGNILSIQDKDVAIETLNYLKEYRIPNDVLQASIDISDEQWSKIIDVVIQLVSNYSE